MKRLLVALALAISVLGTPGTEASGAVSGNPGHYHPSLSNRVSSTEAIRMDDGTEVALNAARSGQYVLARRCAGRTVEVHMAYFAFNSAGDQRTVVSWWKQAMEGNGFTFVAGRGWMFTLGSMFTDGPDQATFCEMTRWNTWATQVARRHSAWAVTP